MNVWNELGFTENPYSPRPIAGDATGQNLLVGRDRELRRLQRYIASSATHPTLEGSNGVGKTSLVAVAGYRLHNAWLKGDSTQAIIPLADPFQLTSDTTIDQLKKRILFQVVQAFIDNHADLKSRGFNVPNTNDIETWLKSPIIDGWSGGLNIGPAGGSMGHTRSANTSAGYSEAGFATNILTWLRNCFPKNSTGAFLCVIDNLELLETSKNARSLLEAARDEVLAIHGLKWVLCGARGIVRSAASSQRLQGVLAEPQDVLPIEDKFIKPLIEARIREFGISGKSNPPVESNGFHHLYRVGNRNLRNAMKYSEDFSMWVEEEKLINGNRENKLSLLEAWMAEVADEKSKAARSVGKRAWEVFDHLVELGGSTSPSDYAEFGFQSNQAMRPHLRSLEQANLIQSAVDETDQRRRTISITSGGWIVNYSRSGFTKLGAG